MQKTEHGIHKGMAMLTCSLELNTSKSLLIFLEDCMADIGSLQDQVSALKKRKAELKLESRRVAQRRRRSSQEPQHLAHILSAAGQTKLLPSLSKIPFLQILLLLALFELSEFQTEVVVAYTLGQGRPSQCRNHGLGIWDADVRSRIGAGLEVLHREVPFEVALGALDSCSEHLLGLCKFIVEYKLFHWLVQMNCRKGVAPGSPQLVAKALLYIPVLAPLAIKLALKKTFKMGSRQMRLWAASFRKRWGSKPGSLNVGEDVEPGVLKRKETQLHLRGHNVYWEFSRLGILGLPGSWAKCWIF